MILHQLKKEEGILHVEPKESLSREDFASVRRELEDYLGKGEILKGVLIRAPEFPGWKNLEGFLSHFEFVLEHQDKIARVAVLTEQTALKAAAPAIDVLVSAELKTFTMDDEQVAIDWLKNA